jgi:hypothetical protein
MKVTGYQIREAIRQWELRRDAALRMFDDSLTFFEGDEKPNPVQVAERFQQADRAIATLQGYQTRFNLALEIKELGVNLGTAVRMVGGAGRLEKMWRSTVGKKKSRYAYLDNTLTRRANEETAKPVLSKEECLELASQAARDAGKLRAFIAAANATAVEIEADPTLFE